MQYLRTGRVAGKAQAGGMMAEAVENSFQLMPETDLRAIAAYLKSTAPVGPESAADSKRPAGTAYGQGRAASDEARRRGMDSQTATASLKSGAALFSGYCASCHQSSGAGSANQAYPSLFHNTATGAGTAANLVATILYGIDRNVGDQHVLMPRFDQKSYVNPLTNQQVADISNYVLASYGNPDLRVTPADVQQSRDGAPCRCWRRPSLIWCRAALPSWWCCCFCCWRGGGRAGVGRARRAGCPSTKPASLRRRSEQVAVRFTVKI